ncbi:hypothetical protein H4R34_002683 [Dimargaris verticillata]|uniref:protein O-GlcNAc transferase n=1 Tax=Dimargaris verticillata TaxID=2761393 RepID=A0A9W8B626_9FUNG|nr:hypothetical protein H4R34_002683 [Dimargaris verticillata]
MHTRDPPSCSTPPVVLPPPHRNPKLLFFQSNAPPRGRSQRPSALTAPSQHGSTLAPRRPLSPTAAVVSSDTGSLAAVRQSAQPPPFPVVTPRRLLTRVRRVMSNNPRSAAPAPTDPAYDAHAPSPAYPHLANPYPPLPMMGSSSAHAMSLSHPNLLALGSRASHSTDTAASSQYALPPRSPHANPGAEPTSIDSEAPNLQRQAALLAASKRQPESNRASLFTRAGKAPETLRRNYSSDYLPPMAMHHGAELERTSSISNRLDRGSRTGSVANGSHSSVANHYSMARPTAVDVAVHQSAYPSDRLELQPPAQLWNTPATSLSSAVVDAASSATPSNALVPASANAVANRLARGRAENRPASFHALAASLNGHSAAGSMQSSKYYQHHTHALASDATMSYPIHPTATDPRAVYDTAYGHFATTAAPMVDMWHQAGATYLPTIDLLQQQPLLQYLPTFNHPAVPQYNAFIPPYQPGILPPPSPNILSYYSYDPYYGTTRLRPYRPPVQHLDYYDTNDHRAGNLMASSHPISGPGPAAQADNGMLLTQTFDPATLNNAAQLMQPGSLFTGSDAVMYPLTGSDSHLHGQLVSPTHRGSTMATYDPALAQPGMATEYYVHPTAALASGGGPLVSPHRPTHAGSGSLALYNSAAMAAALVAAQGLSPHNPYPADTQILPGYATLPTTPHAPYGPAMAAAAALAASHPGVAGTNHALIDPSMQMITTAMLGLTLAAASRLAESGLHYSLTQKPPRASHMTATHMMYPSALAQPGLDSHPALPSGNVPAAGAQDPAPMDWSHTQPRPQATCPPQQRHPQIPMTHSTSLHDLPPLVNSAGGNVGLGIQLTHPLSQALPPVTATTTRALEYLPGTTITYHEAQADAIRDQCLSHAHSFYASDSRSTTLLALLQELHNLHPNHLPTLLLLACVHFSRNEYDLSLQYNQKILALDPNYVEAMSNIGTTLRSMGRAQEAESYWWRAVRHRPGYWDAVENLLGVLCSTTAPPASANGAGPASAGGKGSTAVATSKAAATSEATGGPRYAEALQVCVFVEDHLVRTVTPNVMAVHQPRLRHHVPRHQLPRLQNLFFVKGNLQLALGHVKTARDEYEKALDVVFHGYATLEQALIQVVRYGLQHGVCVNTDQTRLDPTQWTRLDHLPIVMLEPSQAVQLGNLLFPMTKGTLPALASSTQAPAKPSTIQQANQTTATVLLTLAKMFQDHNLVPQPLAVVLPLHYLSLALNPSPSTCNNLGIYLNNIPSPQTQIMLPGVSNGSIAASASTGVAYALQYYTYGLTLDPQHPHLYTNLGSLFKDMGYLNEAVKMYEKAVEYNPTFDVAYANLGNAVKDMGRVQDSIKYYMRAVEENPEFVDALCGMANALSGVCDWRGRTGFATRIATARDLPQERELDDLAKKLFQIILPKAQQAEVATNPTRLGAMGWMDRVVSIVELQLLDGMQWGKGVLLASSQDTAALEQFLTGVLQAFGPGSQAVPLRCKLYYWYQTLQKQRQGTPLTRAEHQALQFMTQSVRNEGGWCIRVVERCLRWIQRRWYMDLYHHHDYTKDPQDISQRYVRPWLPPLPPPPVPTVLPFHTFTYPLDGRQVRLISHRNGLRISHSVLTAPWLPPVVYRPPAPPAPRLHLGYISSDFNNHPLSHLMQSVFGFHDRTRFKVYCYATTASDSSPYREKIQKEVEVFMDVSTWSTQAIVEQVVQDNIHILVNLNGYTKGARNEVFAARPSPVQVSYMGFAGTLGALWTDYFVTDPIVCPQDTVQTELWHLRRAKPATAKTGTKYDALTPSLRASLDEGELDPEEDDDSWVYTERMIYMPHSYFVDDHRQGFREKDPHPLSQLVDSSQLSEAELEERWLYEQDRRWLMRCETFPQIPDDWFIFANFNQLYKIDPTIFHVWLRILTRVPKSIIWLLNFPAAGRDHLMRAARAWGPDPSVAQRIIFTDVAPKDVHIHRGRVADVFLDTPECNGHTTAVDILWSGTPLVTWPRNYHKLCSRVAASVALATGVGDKMIVTTDQEYEDLAVHLATTTAYKYANRMTDPPRSINPNATIDANTSNLIARYHKLGYGPAMDLRKQLFLHRDSNRLFDTFRWTRNLEKGYAEAWRRWETGEDFVYSREEYEQLDPLVQSPMDKAAVANPGHSVRLPQSYSGPFARNRGSIWVQDDDDGAMCAVFCQTHRL